MATGGDTNPFSVNWLRSGTDRPEAKEGVSDKADVLAGEAQTPPTDKMSHTDLLLDYQDGGNRRNPSEIPRGAYQEVYQEEDYDDEYYEE